MILRRAALGLLALASANGCAVSASAYDLEAHAEITRRAARGQDSIVDQVLKTLGFPLGIEAGLSLFTDRHRVTKSATEWLQEGAQQEDQPAKRVVNHFHNPMAPTWAQAGLDVVVPLRAASGRGQSSLLWQQNRGQDAWRISGTLLGISVSGRLEGGNWSWPDATRLYYEALTLEPKPEREAALAKALRALGQVMHLVQDASLPAHTRNDPHVYFEILGMDVGNPDGYERWVDRNLRAPAVLQALSAPIRPSKQIFSLAGSAPRIDRAAAPSPIFRLIDTGRYVGSNPEVLVGDVIGLSEYSNGNFFSNDTIPLRKPEIVLSLPHPAPGDLFLRPEPEVVLDRPAERRRYFEKLTPGEHVPHAALPGALYDYLPAALRDQNTTLDPRVYADHATRLLPRAVGYSAALLDYFFRGKLETRVETRWGLERAETVLQVVNRTDDETMSGDVALLYDRADGSRARLPGWSLTLQALPDGAAADAVAVPPLPDDVSPRVPLLAVFKGRLGPTPDSEEPEAVAATPVALGAFQVATGSSTDTLAGPSDWGDVRFLDASQLGSPPSYQFSLFTLTSAGIAAGPVESSGGSGFSLGFYRSFGVAPGNTARVVAAGNCFTTVVPFPVSETYGSVGPVSAEIVRLKEPDSLGLLYAYRGIFPPQIDEDAPVVFRFTVDSFAGPPVESPPLDVTGVKFFGLRLTTPVSAPPPPAPPEGFVSSSSASCHAAASVTLSP